MEHAHKINAAGNLVGIVNVPDSPLPGNPTILFVNGGFLHRVGPYRLYTNVARELESMGFHVMRFDMAGLGDSVAATSTLTADEQAQSDIQAAIDFMTTTYQSEQVLAAGLCSGADDALAAAEHDARIHGVLLLDGSGFRTRRFYINRVMHHYTRRLVSRQRWQRRLRQLLHQKGSQAQPESAQSLDESMRSTKSPAELRRCVQTLVERGVALHFLFTGGVLGYYNYRGQLFDMLAGINLHGQVSESYHRHCDHMFLLERHRAQVREEMVGWLAGRFGSAECS